MPTISWEGCFVHCVQRLAAELDPALDELLVVFDGVPPEPPAWLREAPLRLLSTGERAGPGEARNLAARQARGEVLLFVDADVELHLGAVQRFRSHFQHDPSLSAVFGSYDDSPAAPGIVSRYRNLLHHHVHQCHPGPAVSFWAGCGAVRRERFLAVGGFDPRYDRPSIEDIEFGRRLSAAGGRILLDPAVQGTHHKRWTLASMLMTDIGRRAIPWSRLLLAPRDAALPPTLNLEPAARWSGGASLLLAGGLLTLPLLPPAGPAGWVVCAGVLAALGVVLALNRRFYGLCLSRYGPGFLLASVPLHLLYFLYSTLAFAVVAVVELPRRWWSALALALLAALALAVLADGLHAALWVPGNDLNERIQEFMLFRDGHYPHPRLVPRPLPPAFRTTPYPPWALPMFAMVAGWGELARARMIMLLVNLAALAVIGWDAWRRLRWAGRSAACAAVLGCVAIAGNVNAFANGQFSLLCMALITGQARLLERRRPRAAGLCWSLAMLKPQIALPFALSFLGAGRRRGLVVGTLLLLVLSALAFLHTRVSPLAWAAAWARPSALAFAREGQTSVMALLVGPLPTAAVLVLPALAAAVLAAAWRCRGRGAVRLPRPAGLDALGVMAVLGALLFYHRNYDNIMLVPALLALFRRSLQRPAPATIALTTSLALSLWLPTRVLVALPWLMPAQSLVWLAAGLVLAFSAAPEAPRPGPAAAAAQSVTAAA